MNRMTGVTGPRSEGRHFYVGEQGSPRVLDVFKEVDK